MNDLPQTPTAQPRVAASGGLNKEAEKVPSGSSESLSAQPEAEPVAPELQAGGYLKARPTSFSVPESLQKIGVSPAGPNVIAFPAQPSVPLPDEKIAEGLTKSWKDSFRWLAEFSKRLKKVFLLKLAGQKK